jgi:1-deoxy-D-xylulose 5-phosphate reductoisomerase
VTAFLARDLAFNRITDVIEAALARVAAGPVGSLDDVLEADRAARAAARDALGRTLTATS